MVPGPRPVPRDHPAASTQEPLARTHSYSNSRPSTRYSRGGARGGDRRGLTDATFWPRPPHEDGLVLSERRGDSPLIVRPHTRLAGRSVAESSHSSQQLV